MPAPPLESLPAIVRARQRGAVIAGWKSTARRRRHFGEHEHELKRWNDLPPLQLEACGLGRAKHRLRVDAIFRRGARTAAAGQEIRDAQASLRLEGLRHVFQERKDLLRMLRIVHLTVRVDDQDRIESCWQA